MLDESQQATKWKKILWENNRKMYENYALFTEVFYELIVKKIEATKHYRKFAWKQNHKEGKYVSSFLVSF